MFTFFNFKRGLVHIVVKVIVVEGPKKPKQKTTKYCRNGKSEKKLEWISSISQPYNIDIQGLGIQDQ